jgi:hypothetical protein
LKTLNGKQQMSDKRREILYLRSAGICAKCQKPLGLDYQRHHGGAHNTEGNRSILYYYTRSLIGQHPLHYHCHEKNPSFGDIPDEHKMLWEILFENFIQLIKTDAHFNFDLLVQELKLLIEENRR